MSKMIDLSMFQQETIDFKFSEELIIKCKKPDEELAIKILAHMNIKQDDISPEQMIGAMNDITLSVLNHNIDNYKVDEAFVRSLTINLKMVILQHYTKEMYEKIENNPNS
jgi:hypothetical protein